jgi:hypothetical protein
VTKLFDVAGTAVRRLPDGREVREVDGKEWPSARLLWNGRSSSLCEVVQEYCPKQRALDIHLGVRAHDHVNQRHSVTFNTFGHRGTPARGASGGLAGASNRRDQSTRTSSDKGPTTARFRLIVDD